jgi:hypothetical protein
VINVPLKGHDLLHEIFLFFVGLGDLVGSTTDVLLGVLKLHVNLLVF